MIQTAFEFKAAKFLLVCSFPAMTVNGKDIRRILDKVYTAI